MDTPIVEEVVNRFRDPEEITLMSLEILSGTGPEVSEERRLISYRAELETQIYLCTWHQRCERHTMNSLSRRMNEISERIENGSEDIRYELSLLVAGYQDEFDQTKERASVMSARASMLEYARDNFNITSFGEFYDFLEERKFDAALVREWSIIGAFTEALEFNVVERGYPQLSAFILAQRVERAQALRRLRADINAQWGEEP